MNDLDQLKGNKTSPEEEWIDTCRSCGGKYKPEDEPMNDFPKSLSSKHITLRPYKDTDTPRLFGWRNDIGNMYLWSHSRRLLSEAEFSDDFRRSLATYIDTHLIIESSSTKEVPGFVYSYDTSMVDRYTFFSIYVDESSRMTRAAGVATVLFYDYLFSYFPFNKIYADIFEFNEASNRYARQNGMVLEGSFRDHRWFSGRFWNLNRYALYRDVWEARKLRYSKILDQASVP